MSLYNDPQLTISCFQVLGLLATLPKDNQGWISITQRDLATQIHRSRSTTLRTLYRLHSLRYIQARRERRGELQAQRSYVAYRLTEKASVALLSVLHHEGMGAISDGAIAR